MKNLASSSIFHHFLKKDLKFSSWVKLVAYLFSKRVSEKVGKKKKEKDIFWIFFLESSLKPPVVDPLMLH